MDPCKWKKNSSLSSNSKIIQVIFKTHHFKINLYRNINDIYIHINDNNKDSLLPKY